MEKGAVEAELNLETKPEPKELVQLAKMVPSWKLISVLIPTYNMGSVLERALKSISSQTHIGIEIIIIDDGSEDNTSDIVKKFEGSLERKDIEVNYFKQAHQGRASALNNAIKRSNGLFFTFLDADDALPEKSLESRIKFLEENPDNDAVYTDANRIGKRGKLIETVKRPPRYPTNIELAEYSFCHRNPPFLHQTLMIRKSSFDKSLEFNPAYMRSQDTDFVYRFLRNKDVGYLSEVTYNYNRADRPVKTQIKNRLLTVRNRCWIIWENVTGIRCLYYIGATIFFEFAKLIYRSIRYEFPR